PHLRLPSTLTGIPARSSRRPRSRRLSGRSLRGPSSSDGATLGTTAAPMRPALSVVAGIVEHMNESLLGPQARRLAALVGELADLPGSVSDDAARIDVIAQLERLKSAVAAAQIQVVEAFATSQEAANRALGFEARA